MDANELRDAAERLTNLGPSNMSGYDHDYYGLTRVGREQIERDGKRVAAAWRAEHDPTPLTADFIRQHTTLLDDGWREFEMEIQVRLAEPFRDTEWRAGWERIPACLIPETVGELRQLLTKCGETLKV
jgi:hypothetical protein